ncbi:MAG: hypothetical protein ACMZ66_16350 [Thalassospira sp.]|uniref:hypothetical protein n=1 Tax=Thalassospira sp. TaxID=1912094 RepID=UPI003A8A8068
MTIVQKARALLAQTALGDLYHYYKVPRVRAKYHLKKSMDAFQEEYDSYWASVNSDRTLTTMKEQFDDIQRNGFTIVENYIDQIQLAAIRSEVDSLEGFANGQYEGDLTFTNRPDDGICALSIDQSMPETYKVSIGNEDLHGLARALYGCKTRLSGASLLNKYGVDKIDSSNAPHWDDWRVRLKSFLYLSDVDEEHAATIYCKGSHKDLPWRFEKDFCSVFMSHEASAGGSWWPVDALGFEKVLCKGKAGALVIFDTAGIHAGTNLKKDNRLMIMNMYTTHLDFTHRAF